MRRKLFTLLFVAMAFIAGAANQNIKLSANRTAATVQESNMKQLNVHFSYANIHSQDVNTKNGEFAELDVPGTYFTGKIGEAKLPASKELIAIPFGANVTVSVKNYSVQEYKLSDYGVTNQLMPTQPSMRKDQKPSDMKFEYNKAAYNMGYTKGDIASVEVLGTLRGMRLARLTVEPVQYNAAEGTITVYNDIDVEVSFNDADEALTQHMMDVTASPYFDVVYRSVLNKGVYDEHPDLTKYPVKYLIVSDRMFESTLAPFIEWKTKKGFDVTVAYTDEIGTSYNTIETYVHAQYNDAVTAGTVPPSFVLLVGDVNQVPSKMGSSSQKKTDLYYASVDGDYFPEMYYGRFSAQNVAQLQAQIDKTLYYEQYQFEDPSYLDRVTLISGADGNWNPKVGQATITYGTTNYFNEEHGFSTVNKYLTSYSGCYSTINDGVGFINYTAHGSRTSWADPALSQSGVNALTNENQYPLAVGNCCLAADFGENDECFGETWMRAANKGSVNYIGSSPSSYWFEDFYWSVGAFAVQGTNNGYVPTVEETTMGTYDAMFTGDYVCADATVFVGNLAVTEVDVQGYPQHSSPLYYWQAYNCLGDPSVMIYHTQGEENAVSHMDIVPLGADFYEVTAVVGSYVAISKDGVLHGAGIVPESGTAHITITPITSGGDVDLVVTKSQYKPVIKTVPAASLTTPYVTFNEYTLNDVAGNDNGQLDYNEAVKVNAVLKNVGSQPASSVNAVVSTEDAFVTITDNSADFGTIASNTTSSVDDAFAFSVASNVPDKHMITFNVVATGTEGSWNSSFSVEAHAGVLTIGDFTLTEGSGANGNGRLDAGETAIITVPVSNSGSADLTGAAGVLSSVSSFITITSATGAYGDIAAGVDVEKTYTVEADAATPTGTLVEFKLNVTADLDLAAEKMHNVVVGQVPAVIVDFDGTHNSANKIKEAMDAIGVTNQLMTSMPEDLSLYASAWVCLGMYSDNHALSSTEGAALAEFLSNGGRLYMEGGDTWKYDTPTAAHAMFNIKGEDDGSSDLATITGQSGTIVDGMDFVYSGDNKYVDHISALGDASLIFKNSSPSYGCGVANEGDNYKTIGVSFEFGGLTDGAATRVQLMEKYLAFFSMQGGAFTAAFIADNVNIVVNNTVNFTDVSVGGTVTAWEWTFEGGNPASSTEQNPSVTYATEGTFDVTLKVTAGDEVSTVTKQDYIGVGPDGVVTLNQEVMNIYPNPSNGVVNVNFNSFNNSYSLRVIDLQGRIVSSVEGLASNNAELNLQGNNNGIYFVEIISDNGVVYRQKLMLK